MTGINKSTVVNNKVELITDTLCTVKPKAPVDNCFVKIETPVKDTINVDFTKQPSAITELKFEEPPSQLEKDITSLTHFGDVSLENVSIPVKGLGNVIKPLVPMLEKQDEISVKIKVKFSN